MLACISLLLSFQYSYFKVLGILKMKRLSQISIFLNVELGQLIRDDE